MGYQNAKRGITLIFIGQLLAVAGAIAGIIGVAIATASGGEDGSFSEIGAASMIMLVSALGCALAAFLFKFFGISKASIDDDNFKKALIFLVVGLVAGIVQNALDNRLELISNLGGIVNNVCDLAVTLFIILGVVAIANNVGNVSVAELGNKTMKLMIIVYLLAIALNVIVLLISSKNMEVVEGILSIGAIVVSIIAYIMFLKMLNQARLML